MLTLEQRNKIEEKLNSPEPIELELFEPEDADLLWIPCLLEERS